MADAYFLSESDVKTLKEIIAQFRSGRINSQIRTENYFPGDDQVSPDTYIALPQDTITGLTAAGGTGTGPGDGDMPGSGVCDLYKIDADGILVSILSDVTVYNLASAIVRQWVLVTRSKFGHWMVLNSAGGSLGLFLARAQENIPIFSSGLVRVDSGEDTSGLAGEDVSVINIFGEITSGDELLITFNESLGYIVVQGQCGSVGTGTGTGV